MRTLPQPNPTLPHLRGRQTWIFLICSWCVLTCLAPGVGWGQDSTPTKTSDRVTPPSGDLEVSPREEIQVLDGVDPASNTQTAAAAPYTPPAAPTGLSVLVLKEGVYLSWEPESASGQISAYNVYRSTAPGSGYRQMNVKPLQSPYFLDGPPNTLDSPQNGEDYFYVVNTVDFKGTVSPYSDEIAITPQGMEIPPTEEQKKAAEKAKATPGPEDETTLKIPEQNLINLKLPADSQLSIQGYKKIETDFSFQDFPKRNATVNGISSSVNSTTVNQELTVNLQGKIGKNIDVNVDYSDVNRAGGVDQSKQDISINYHGDADSAVQEVSFGDLTLLLPNTQFAGFSKQLFGLQAKLKVDQFNLTSFFAQTKGISETKIFKGNSSQVDKIIQDIDYLRLKYFRITKEGITINSSDGSVTIASNALPQNNTEQIWVDSGTGIQNPTGTNFGGANNAFEHWLPGRDYTMDYSTGIITFIRALPSSARVAVSYARKDGATVGFAGAQPDLYNGLKVDPNGIVQNNAHLIKDNINPADVSPLYLVNYFDLGQAKIIPPDQDPDFLFEIINQGSSNTLQTGQGNASAATPWIYNINQDLNYLTVDKSSNVSMGIGVTAAFPERAFVNAGVSINQSMGTETNGVYSQTTTPTSLYRVHIKYKTRLDFYQMNRFNIIRGTESVYLDGRLLRRDTDYTFDYTTGFLDFQDKSIVRPDSQIVVTYEYAPFGSFNQDNILGARAEYDLTDHFILGSTFLYSTAQQPTDTPSVGSTPDSLALFDADAKYDLGPDDIQSLTGIIPGLENWKPPLKIQLSAEIAKSYYDPDTFNAEGENGVAMVDNMEGTDNVVGPSMNATSWLVSSAPLPISQYLNNGFGGNYVDGNVDSGLNANNRIRFTNGTTTFQVANNLTTPNLPGVGGHIFSATQNQTDYISTLEFPYSHLSNQRWGGLRQVISATGTDLSQTLFLQTWIYSNDQVDKWVMVDFGMMDEDTDGLGILQSDDILNQKNPNENYGIPTFYFPGNPWSAGGSAAATVVGLSGESSSQEGQNTGAFVTQDLNGNNVLDPPDNSYYEYGIHIDSSWNGWRLVKIPVNFQASPGAGTTSEGVNYFFNTEGAPSPQVIRVVRLWMTGGQPSEGSGYILAENISFTRNLWQLEVDPQANIDQGVTVNTGKFDVNSISHDQDSRYQGSLRFLTVQQGQDQDSITTKEKALKITYSLSSADQDLQNGQSLPDYYTTRTFVQGLDFTDYQEMRMDLQVRSFNPGEVLFVRVGNDQADYYQYNVPLSGSYINNWNNIIIPLDGSGGNRKTVGTPFINRAVQVSIGVISPNQTPGTPGEMWINNLRLDSPVTRSGLARRADAAFILGDNFATVNARYNEVDSGFSQLDQTSTRFQHSTQVGADYSSSGVKLFSQPLVTQVSITQQDLYTEPALSQNPYYLTLPNSHINNATGSISYTKDLGVDFGRLTNLRVSGSSNYETDAFQQAYLSQPGVQGNTTKGEDNFTVASTYDAPNKVFGFLIGSNQFTQTYSVEHDTQNFQSTNFSPYDRWTKTQTYSWTNNSELVKNLVFTPGYAWTLVDAEGNTNTPGVPGGVSSYSSFQQRYQPKVGLLYRGIPGLTPSVDYSGSDQYDYFSFTDGPRFTSANNMNYSINMTPGSWSPFFQKMNLAIFAGRTESGSSSIPNFTSLPPLTFEQQWMPLSAPSTFALNATESVAHRLDVSFKLFDVWEFHPSGSWTDQLSVLSLGSNPVKQNGSTLGLTSVYNKKILTLPFIALTFDSAQFQYTHTENNQFESADESQTATGSYSDTYSFTLPYDIHQEAQGNLHVQTTIGRLNTSGITTNQLENQISLEYTQKFAPNLVLHIPFTHSKIKLNDAIEFHATLLADLVDNISSDNPLNDLKTERYRGTIEFDYNALKNLRVGIGFVNEYFFNDLSDSLNYVLYQGTVSAEARF